MKNKEQLEMYGTWHVDGIIRVTGQSFLLGTHFLSELH